MIAAAGGVCVEAGTTSRNRRAPSWSWPIAPTPAVMKRSGSSAAHGTHARSGRRSRTDPGARATSSCQRRGHLSAIAHRDARGHSRRQLAHPHVERSRRRCRSRRRPARDQPSHHRHRRDPTPHLDTSPRALIPVPFDRSYLCGARYTEPRIGPRQARTSPPERWIGPAPRHATSAQAWDRDRPCSPTRTCSRSRPQPRSTRTRSGSTSWSSLLSVLSREAWNRSIAPPGQPENHPKGHALTPAPGLRPPHNPSRRAGGKRCLRGCATADSAVPAAAESEHPGPSPLRADDSLLS